MVRVLLDDRGDTIELAQGESTIGRGLACTIRFNDDAISRRHLRLSVGKDTATVEDLGSANGTMLNDAPLRAVTTLANGDVIQIGDRTLRVRLYAKAAQVGAEDGTEEITQTRNRAAEAPRDVGRPTTPPARQEVPIPRLDQRNCPSCRARTDATDSTCRACGNPLRPPRPGSITREYVVPEALRGAARARLENAEERRRDIRHPVLLPVVYASDDLTFDAIARDLSLQGMFLETELLEPVGTSCTLTVLADGAPAITLAAVVSRVVDTQRPSGLGLRVTSMGPEAEAWLTHVIERLEAISRSALAQRNDEA